MRDDDDLDFDADRFSSAPPPERARLCRVLADRAQHLADVAEPQFRDAYAKIAQEWRGLAEDIEAAIVTKRGGVRR